MHGRVEEAYGAVSHVAPAVTLNPLIARTMVEHMINVPVSTSMQQKGLGVADMTTLQTVGDIEKSRHQALAPHKATGKKSIMEVITGKATQMREGIADVAKAKPPVPPPEKLSPLDRASLKEKVLSIRDYTERIKERKARS